MHQDDTALIAALEQNRWLDRNGELYAVGFLLNPVRYPYFHRVLAHKLMHSPSDLSVLDVGCGGGSLSVLFKRSGYRVTGVDPDGHGIRAARTQATRAGVAADFKGAAAENLPFCATAFDVVIVSEVLEHVDDLATALDEIVRVLKVGGVLLFSMPNRSMLSYLLLIKLAQDWRLTAVLTDVHHHYQDLIGPEALRAALAVRGIDIQEIQGVRVPLGALPVIAVEYLKHKTGRTPLARLAATLDLSTGGSTQLAFIAWGVKYG